MLRFFIADNFVVFSSPRIFAYMTRERINKKLRNETQIATAERRLASATAKAAYWETRINKLRNEQLQFQLERQMPLGPSTRKNQKKYVVWVSVREILMEPSRRGGMTTAELFEATQEQHSRLSVITFRAYLREFSSPNRGLLEKRDGRWHLAKMVTNTLQS